jgi:hypothetical protein
VGIWSTGTIGDVGDILKLGNDGNITVTEGDAPLWSSNSAQGFTLLPNQSVSSMNGQYTLILQADGNLVEYDASGVPLWASGTAGQHVTAAIMQADGNLVLYNGNTAVWNTLTPGHPGAYLNLQNNGALIIGDGGTQLWDAQINLSNGGYLLPGQSLASPNGLFTLTLLTNGNLVEFNELNEAIWQSSTAGMNVAKLVMQTDGNLVLYNTSGKSVWATNTSGNPYTDLAVEDNGNIDVFSGNKQIWTTAVETN